MRADLSRRNRAKADAAPRQANLAGTSSPATDQSSLPMSKIRRPAGRRPEPGFPAKMYILLYFPGPSPPPADFSGLNPGV